MKNTTIQHILWDWNGTLLDDVQFCVDIMNQLLQKYGLKPLSLAYYKSIFQIPVIDYYRALGFDFEKTPFDALGKEFMDQYNQDRYCCNLFSEARWVLQQFKDLGLNQMVLSAYHQDSLTEFIRFFDLEHFFSQIIGVKNIYAQGKLERAEEWIRSHQIPKDSILLIGDTEHDYEVANQMGVACVLVAQGHSHSTRLKNCGVPVLHSLSAVLDWISHSH